MKVSDSEINDSQKDIIETCESLKRFLLEKNKRYGNSALEPINVFSKLSSEEGIKLRLDDKIKRIKNSTELRKNDVIDLTGYLILMCVHKRWTNFDDLLDWTQTFIYFKFHSVIWGNKLWTIMKEDLN